MRELGELRAAWWTDRGDENRARYGFTDDGYKLTFELKVNDKPRVLTVELGGFAPNQFPYALAVVDGQSWIFEFPPTLFWRMQRDLANPPLRAPDAP